MHSTCEFVITSDKNVPMEVDLTSGLSFFMLNFALLSDAKTNIMKKKVVAKVPLRSRSYLSICSEYTPAQKEALMLSFFSFSALTLFVLFNEFFICR